MLLITIRKRCKNLLVDEMLAMNVKRNYPMLMATWKVAPALASGCAAILKPSELASV